MNKDTSAHKRKIISIEDEESMAELIMYILRSHGYEGLAAANGQEGLEMMRREKPDLVLLDIMLPGIDGWEVYRQMKADSGLWSIGVIVVTCKSRPIDEVLARHIAMVDDYIAKPFNPRSLVKSIEQVLRIRQADVSALQTC